MRFGHLGAAARAVCRGVVLIAIAVASMAHVGSPDTFFSGQAGPYPVRVTVRLPGVIPGLAQISVRLIGISAASIDRVTVQAVQWNLGVDGAPPPDVAVRVPGDAELYATDLWFMAATSYRVLVHVQGRSGEGTAIVPVVAIATAEREMPRSLGIILTALGLFLFVGLLTIVGAAVRESGLPPGEAPDARRRRRARVVTAFAAVLLAFGVFGGRAWWNAEAAAYGQSVLFRPFASRVDVKEDGARRMLTLSIDDRRWPPRGNAITRYNTLMPDHGKLMHMFLIREPALDAFAHLHPVARDGGQSFDVELPPLPSGRYRVYGDIVHESGYAQTLVASATLNDSPTAQGTPRADPDDSWFTGGPVQAVSTITAPTEDGTTIAWQHRGSLVAGTDQLLTFTVRQPDGAPATLEPYMGMLAHVAITRTDGAVFAHLHPFGSVSMAAVQKFTPSQSIHMHTVSTGNVVSVPYAFPKSGRYRMWVQVKRSGKVLTGAFDVDVN
jgi:hypothetical protein